MGYLHTFLIGTSAAEDGPRIKIDQLAHKQVRCRKLVGPAQTGLSAVGPHPTPNQPEL